MLLQRQDKLHQHLQFPTVLGQIVATDDRICLAKSDQALKLTLHHKSAFYWFYQSSGTQVDNKGNLVIEDVDR